MTATADPRHAHCAGPGRRERGRVTGRGAAEAPCPPWFVNEQSCSGQRAEHFSGGSDEAATPTEPLRTFRSATCSWAVHLGLVEGTRRIRGRREHP